MNKLVIGVLGLALASTAACQNLDRNDRQDVAKDAAIGALGGAAIGAATGGNALEGAAIGGAVGGGYGVYKGNQN